MGVLAYRRGRTRASHWAYWNLAVGALSSRRGHRHNPPWAYSPTAPGTVTVRAGRTSRTRWAYYPRSTSALRVSSPREHCPIKDEEAHAKAPQPTSGAPRSMCNTTVFRAHAEPPEHNRTTGKSRNPPPTAAVSAGHGRALRASRVDRGRKHGSSWAYTAPAMGVPAQRHGRTSCSLWAHQLSALGVLTPRRGRTRPSRWAHCPRAVAVLGAVNDQSPQFLTPQTLPHQGQAGANESAGTNIRRTKFHAQDNNDRATR